MHAEQPRDPDSVLTFGLNLLLGSTGHFLHYCLGAENILCIIETLLIPFIQNLKKQNPDTFISSQFHTERLGFHRCPKGAFGND